MRKLTFLLAGVAWLAACGKGPGDPTGVWTLYVPPDMVRQAQPGKEVPPQGTLEVRRDGTFAMRIQAQDRSYEMQGRWTAQNGSFSVEGTERETDREGRSSDRRVRSQGTLSADGRILRVYGRDFVR
ncbi:MAG: hypothetical protein N2109_03500 [Fimbriimonadales bacterium]|nr:hypothetical protein [Fimbriimonadales bacterium]